MLETLDDRLAMVPCACHCPICGRDWLTSQPQLLLTTLGVTEGKALKIWCEPCSRKPRQSSAKAPPRRFDLWKELCPAEYRLTSEEGNTERDMLKKAWGEKVGTDERLSCGQIAELVTHHGPVILAGEPGTMKTRLAWRMVKMVWNKPLTVLCMTSWQFQSQLQEASGQHRATEWMRSMTAAALVFIDDLGKSEWTANTHGAFFELVEARISNRRTLLITTNEILTDVKETRQGHKSAVAQSTAQAIIRRLKEFSVTVIMQKPTT